MRSVLKFLTDKSFSRLEYLVIVTDIALSLAHKIPFWLFFVIVFVACVINAMLRDVYEDLPVTIKSKEQLDGLIKGLTEMRRRVHGE